MKKHHEVQWKSRKFPSNWLVWSLHKDYISAFTTFKRRSKKHKDWKWRFVTIFVQVHEEK